MVHKQCTWRYNEALLVLFILSLLTHRPETPETYELEASPPSSDVQVIIKNKKQTRI